MNLEHNIFNNLKDNKTSKNFIDELSNYIENNVDDYTYNDLLEDDLTLYNKKITVKYRDEMLIKRANILKDYAENTKEKGEMLYIYGISRNDKSSYNLYNCSLDKNNGVITRKIEELPNGAILGSVLRKQGNNLILDKDDTTIIACKINAMIKNKIKEQDKYLDSLRIDGHTYEVGEKNSGRIWLYDLNNTVDGGVEAIEEIIFPDNLYELAREGDLFKYENGEYYKIKNPGTI